jgi:glucose-6-phosphate 1-dehydrogenase
MVAIPQRFKERVGKTEVQQILDRLAIPNPRWAGVPFLVRTGKCLSVTSTEVYIRLKSPPVSLFQDSSAMPNTFTFRLSPDVSISLSAAVKRPGEAMVGDQVRLVEHQQDRDEMRPYERLLGDALRGDRTLFGDEAGVEASWRVVDGVLNDKTAPLVYDPQSGGPGDADTLAADVGGWITPPARG